jgi:hypothetical protein
MEGIMRKHSKLLIISLSLLIFVGIVCFNYMRTEYGLSQNPGITEFSNKDIETFEKEFLLKFPKDTEFIGAQYFYGWQDTAVLGRYILLFGWNNSKSNSKQFKCGICA